MLVAPADLFRGRRSCEAQTIMMIPGAWEPRQRSPAVAAASAPATDGSVALIANAGAIGVRARVETGAARAEPAAWVKVSIFATVLLVATIVAMCASTYGGPTTGVAHRTTTDTRHK
jgi:hypothetical protein